MVRRLEAHVATQYSVDTPAYWRAMSDRLAEALAVSRFAPINGRYRDRASERAYLWLVRVAGAYRALAKPGAGR